MKKTIITLAIIGVGAAAIIYYGRYKRKEFDKNCNKNGGRVVKSGMVCDLK